MQKWATRTAVKKLGRPATAQFDSGHTAMATMTAMPAPDTQQTALIRKMIVVAMHALPNSPGLRRSAPRKARGFLYARVFVHWWQNSHTSFTKCRHREPSRLVCVIVASAAGSSSDPALAWTPRASRLGHWNSNYTTKAAPPSPVGHRLAKLPSRLSRMPQRARWKSYASRSGVFAPAGKTDKVTVGTTLKSLERILGSPKGLLRALRPALHERLDGRRLSVDLEDAWLIVAGFLLRPGFGVVGDDLRIDALWRLHDAGPCFPGRRIKCQEYILWRRVAGGLTRERQNKLLAGELDRIRSGKAPAELVRLAGSLELIPHDTKAERAALVERRSCRRHGHASECHPGLGCSPGSRPSPLQAE
jgi:hypothetical protein